MISGDQILLTVNAGSSSLKLAMFRRAQASAKNDTVELVERWQVAPGDGVDVMQKLLANGGTRSSATLTTQKPAPITAIAHRVVHGGDERHECVALDAAETARLRALSPLAPLHQPAAFALIDAIAAMQPTLPQYACFDTAFHASIPQLNRTCALPAEIRAKYPALHAYGFHGLSCRSAMHELQRTHPDLCGKRIVIAHLGSGASVTAVHEGHSTATSMGFSALDGLVMGTRPGRIDPGVLLYLLRHEKLDSDALEDLLYHRCGLLGLSGVSSDLRELLASNDAQAAFAVDVFVQRIVTETGALIAALGGLDVLVFTGGIGEHQPVIRERVAQKLHWLGENVQFLTLACDEEAVMACAVHLLRGMLINK